MSRQVGCRRNGVAHLGHRSRRCKRRVGVHEPLDCRVGRRRNGVAHLGRVAVLCAPLALIFVRGAPEVFQEAVLLLAHHEGVRPVQVVEEVDRLPEARARWTLHGAPQRKKTAAALTADEALANAALEGRLVDVTAGSAYARVAACALHGSQGHVKGHVKGHVRRQRPGARATTGPAIRASCEAPCWASGGASGFVAVS